MATNNKLNLLVESYQVKKKDEGIIIEGIALPFGKISRNGVKYREESIKRTFKTLENKPLLFNHNPDKVIGHIEKVELTDKGLKYTANVDPAEEWYVRKLERGDINKVSIQVIYDENTVESKENYLEVDIQEFLELSLVTIPGFEDTSAQLVEKYKGDDKMAEVDKRYQNPDGTFKKMTCPDDPNGKPSKFCGCVRYMMSQGKSLDSAKKICAYIKQRKYGHNLNEKDIADILSEFLEFSEVDKMETKKEQNDELPEQDPVEVLTQAIQEIKDKLNDIEARLSKVEEEINKQEEQKEEPEEEKPEEEKEKEKEKEKEERLTIANVEKENTITLSELKTKLKYA